MVLSSFRAEVSPQDRTGDGRQVQDDGRAAISSSFSFLDPLGSDQVGLAALASEALSVLACAMLPRLVLAAFAVLIATETHAAVLCARQRSDGSFNATVKIRDACKRTETVLQPEAVGFCCTTTTTTTTGTTFVGTSFVSSTITVTSTFPPTTGTSCTGRLPPFCPEGHGSCILVGLACLDDGNGHCACGSPSAAKALPERDRP